MYEKDRNPQFEANFVNSPEQEYKATTKHRNKVFLNVFFENEPVLFVNKAPLLK